MKNKLIEIIKFIIRILTFIVSVILIIIAIKFMWHFRKIILWALLFFAMTYLFDKIPEIIKWAFKK